MILSKTGRACQIFLLVLLFSSHFSWPLFAEQPGIGYRLLTGKGIAVYYRPPDDKVARQYLDWAVSFTPRPGWLDTGRLPELRIYIAPTLSEFDRLSGGRLPEWGVACALPGEKVVIVRSPRIVPLWLEDPKQILLHEISHVILEHWLSPAEIPRWFHEGYAQYASGMWDIGNSLEFSVALLVGMVQPLDALAEGFPQDEKAARRAYLQSYTAVEYLFIHWEKAHLELLFRKWREMSNLDRALRMSLGLTLGQFEKRWKKWAEVRYGWLKLLTSVTLIWILAGALFIAVYVSRRVRFKRRLAEMRHAESASRAGLVPGEPDQAASEYLQPPGIEESEEERPAPPAND
jgi:hypothetical protein